MRFNRSFAVVTAAGALLLAIPVATAFGSSDAPPPPRVDTRDATALGNAITYQGRLTENGQPANGQYDLRFVVYDAEVSGSGTSPVEVGDVNVVNGLFTVPLTFPEGTFSGNAAWMEIAVRPGNSSGTYTALSPRQPITPTPFALFAKSAGALALPFAATADNDTGAAVAITQEGNGAGVSVTADGPQPAIAGVNDGSGAAVEGSTTDNAGVGVQGVALGTGGRAGSFLGNGAGTTALQIGNGGIEVTGTARPAFVWVVDQDAEGGNTCSDDKATILDNAIINGKPNAILAVTAQADSIDDVPPLAVVYGPAGCDGADDKWVVFDSTLTELPDGLHINVVAILAAAS